uniref:Uncharacterized protein n=1 Tax=Rhizophora mucronata TaxID=61149 RepID=A0A2P2QDV7_RHIMU
MNQCLIIE